MNIIFTHSRSAGDHFKWLARNIRHPVQEIKGWPWQTCQLSIDTIINFVRFAKAFPWLAFSEFKNLGMAVTGRSGMAGRTFSRVKTSCKWLGSG